MEHGCDDEHEDGAVQGALVDDGEVVQQRTITHGQGDQGAHGGGVREIHPHRGLPLRQLYCLLLLLLLDEGHELLIAVHVDHGGGGGHDDAGQEVEQHADRGVEQQRLVLVEHVLGPHHVHLVHDRHRGERHQVLDPIAHQLDREEEGDALVGLPEDAGVPHGEDEERQGVVDVLCGAGMPQCLGLEKLPDLVCGMTHHRGLGHTLQWET